MNNKILIAAFFLFVIVWLTTAYYNGRKLRSSHHVTNAVITSVNGGGKGNWGPGIEYTFYIKSKNLNSSRRHGGLKYSITRFVGKSFPVVYRYNGLWYDDVILITPNDFKRYGYAFPDSLAWVLKYLE